MREESEAVRYLLSPEAVRERCQLVFAAARAGRTAHFDVRMDKLADTARVVCEVARAAYPTLQVPYHSRWNHFRAAGVDRVADFERRIAGLPVAEQARARYDLVVTSVLLDAGAGEQWRFREGALEVGRSEGLAVASYHLFVSGALSNDPARQPYRADGEALARLQAAQLAEAFQVSASNPLIGVEGRVALLNGLGRAVASTPQIFAEPRVGAMYDFLYSRAREGQLPAREILAAVLRGLGSIWPGRITLDGVNLGDVWRHPAADTAAGPASTQGLVPFHKLSQWLSYSLIEPLEAAGVRVVDVDALTGLPEYRNGGLFLDAGVLAPKHAAILGEAHAPGDEAIVEWRALTVCLLDAIADPVRAQLGVSREQFALAKVLEAGTWAAGRKLAKEKRADGGSPIRLRSDGTVF